MSYFRTCLSSSHTRGRRYVIGTGFSSYLANPGRKRAFGRPRRPMRPLRLIRSSMKTRHLALLPTTKTSLTHFSERLNVCVKSSRMRFSVTGASTVPPCERRDPPLPTGTTRPLRPIPLLVRVRDCIAGCDDKSSKCRAPFPCFTEHQGSPCDRVNRPVEAWRLA